MIKKFICLSVLIVVAFFGVGCASTLNNQPDSKNEEFIGETISYVSLGDSIPEGYYLPKYEEKDEYGFVKQSYTHSLKSFFESKYKEVHAHNYATAGLTSTQLKEQLMALDGQTLSQNEEEMKMNIIGADVITVCIGANDILTPALDNFLNIVLNEDISSYLTEFDNGIAAFTSNFPIIVSKLKELNPTAKLIFSNIYNPYKDFITATSNIEIYYLLYKIYDIPYEKGEILEVICEENPKTATCKGGILTSSNDVNFDPDTLKFNLLGIDSDKTIDNYRYIDVNDGIINSVVDRVESMIDYILSPEKIDFYIKNFGVNQGKSSIINELCKIRLKEYAKSALDARKDELQTWNADETCRLEETLFFFPVIGMLNNLAREMAK